MNNEVSKSVAIVSVFTLIISDESLPQGCYSFSFLSVEEVVTQLVSCRHSLQVQTCLASTPGILITH